MKDVCDNCGRREELFHNEASGLAVCGPCDIKLEDEASLTVCGPCDIKLEDEAKQPKPLSFFINLGHDAFTCAGVIRKESEFVEPIREHDFVRCQFTIDQAAELIQRLAKEIQDTTNLDLAARQLGIDL